MTTTTAETLAYSGVVLNTYAKNIESIAGRLQIPGKRTGNIELAGREGLFSPPTKRWDQNVIGLPMWIRGCDDNGAIPSGNARIEFWKNHDALQRIFQLPGLQPLVWTLPDGTTRQADVEMLDSIDHTIIGSNPLGKFAVSLTIPDAFWHDVAAVTDTLTTPAVAPTQVSCPNLSGGTAPIDDMLVTVHGPWNGFSVTDVVSGEVMSYSQNLISTDVLVIDCANYTCTLNGVSRLTPLVHSSSQFFRLQPDLTGACKVKFTGTGLTGASVFTIQARRRWLAG